jgi:hypothetical protein
MTNFQYNSPSPYNPRFLRVQNRRARTMFEFSIATARLIAAGEDEAKELQRVANWYEKQFFDGMVVEIAVLFPSQLSRRFWCRAFLDAASDVVQGKLGNQSLHFWKARCVCDLSLVGRMLLEAAKELEPVWQGPLPRDFADEQTWNERPPGGAH